MRPWAIARATAGQTTPQETLVLTAPRTYTASATVLFEDCPLIPSGEDTNPTTPETPTNTPSDTPSRTTPDTPVPYSPPLEDAHLPGVDRIVAEVSRRLG